MTTFSKEFSHQISEFTDVFATKKVFENTKTLLLGDTLAEPCVAVCIAWGLARRSAFTNIIGCSAWRNGRPDKQLRAVSGSAIRSVSHAASAVCLSFLTNKDSRLVVLHSGRVYLLISYKFKYC